MSALAEGRATASDSSFVKQAVRRPTEAERAAWCWGRTASSHRTFRTWGSSGCPEGGKPKSANRSTASGVGYPTFGLDDVPVGVRARARAVGHPSCWGQALSRVVGLPRTSYHVGRRSSVVGRRSSVVGCGGLPRLPLGDHGRERTLVKVSDVRHPTGFNRCAWSRGSDVCASSSASRKRIPGLSESECVREPSGLHARHLHNLCMTSGHVEDIAQAGNDIIVGGQFHHVQNAGGGTTYGNSGLFAFNVDTGQIDLNFGFPQFDGTIFSVVAAPDGQTVYVGALFRMSIQRDEGRPVSRSSTSAMVRSRAELQRQRQQVIRGAGHALCERPPLHRGRVHVSDRRRQTLASQLSILPLGQVSSE